MFHNLSKIEVKVVSFSLTHYSPVFPFYIPWKHQKTFRFSEKAAMGCNGLNHQTVFLSFEISDLLLWSALFCNLKKMRYNSFQSQVVVGHRKSSILDVWQYSEYVSVDRVAFRCFCVFTYEPQGSRLNTGHHQLSVWVIQLG